MPTPAIRIEQLGKQYKIGLRENAKRTFGEALMHTLTTPLRRLRNLREKSTGDDLFWALRDVSFEVKRGDVVGIIGRNGAGKSTLLKILSRVVHPTEGRVEIRGRVGSLLEVGTGFHPELTGRENIYLNGAILGMKQHEIRSKFDEIVAFSEIDTFLDTPVKRYSSGMYVRLAFAVAAHLEPEVLIVDEVLAVGDAAFQRKCLGKMGDVAGAGRTVLFVSHNMQAVSHLCNKAVLLDQGRVTASGLARDIIEGYIRGSVTEGGSAEIIHTRTVPDAAVTIDAVTAHDGYISACDFDLAQPIHLKIRYTVHRPMEGVYLAFQVRTLLGQPVFTSTNADMDDSDEPFAHQSALDSTPHTGEAEIEIPAHVLNAGTFEINVASYAPGHGTLDLVTNTIISVHDSGSFASRPFNRTRDGLVLCRLPWQLTQNVPQAQGV